MSVITGQGVTAYPLPDEELSPTSKNAVSNEAVCEGLDEIKNTLNHKADMIYDTASGDIASFPDGADGLPVKDLTVGIEPVQDLHGYENPWPAGGGKNKAVISAATIQKPSWYQGGWSGVSVNNNNGITQTKGYNDGGAGGFVITLSEGVYTVSLTYNGNESCVLHIVSWNGTESTLLCDNVTMIKNGARFVYSFTVPAGSIEISIRPTKNGSAQGVPYNFDDIQVEAGSTATAFAPYSNICPISGWTGCNVTRMGKNLLRLVESEMYSTGGWNRWFPNPITKPGTYTISCQSSFGGTGNKGAKIIFVAEKGSDTAVGSEIAPSSFGDESTSATFTVTEEQANAGYIEFQMRSARSTYDSIVSGRLQIELGSTATSYEPYSGTTIPISWQSEAGTVYGGTLDVTSGVLTVDRAMKIMNGSETWRTGVTNKYYTDISITIAEASAISNIGVLVTPASLSSLTKDGEFVVQGKNDPRIIFYSSLSLDGWQTYLGSNNAQLLFKLATPLVVQLDSVTVTTLLGQNNVWSDTGSSTVEYPADTKLYIQKINAPTDDDMVADANITSGQYFIVNNNLYISTAAILAGDPIKPGTNCTMTNLAAALNAINS